MGGGGDYVLVEKFMGGILSTYTKMSKGGGGGGLCPYPRGGSAVAQCRVLDSRLWGRGFVPHWRQ